MRSMASGAAFHRAYPRATQQAFLEAHEHAFAYFGGVFRTLRYDNLTWNYGGRCAPAVVGLTCAGRWDCSRRIRHGSIRRLGRVARADLDLRGR